MKKFIYSLLAFVLVLPLAFGLAGCNKDGLKKSDVVGGWYTVSVSRTQGENTTTYTYERFNELHTKGDGRTGAENYEYNQLSEVFLKYQLTDDNKLKAATYAENAEYTECGTWEIKDNKLNFTIAESAFGSGTATAEYKDSKIVVTIVDGNTTIVLTLAKVA